MLEEVWVTQEVHKRLVWKPTLTKRLCAASFKLALDSRKLVVIKGFRSTRSTLRTSSVIRSTRELA
jgi:hypothetical protein